MKRVNQIIVLVFFLLLFTNCSQSKVELTKSSWDIPQADENSGIVYGLLLSSISKNPVKGTPFLARNLSSNDPEIPATISFSLQTDPRAVLNEHTGEFYFKVIEPGDNYVIVLHYGPGKILIVRDQSTELPIMVEVELGRSIDIGTFFVVEP